MATVPDVERTAGEHGAGSGGAKQNAGKQPGICQAKAAIRFQIPWLKT
jgi:hypothetical protein